LEDRPEALNLVTIYATLTESSVEDVLKDFGGEGFGKFKPALGEVLVETLRPISERFTDLLSDREALDAILARGASQAREIGRPTLEATYAALGLIR
jgi:tryptophanyl-tRNA synthetase